MILSSKSRGQNLVLKAQLVMLGFLIMSCSCERSRFIHDLTGFTMGTTYSVKIVTAYRFLDKTIMKEGIDSIFHELNRQMSTWDMESEISMFNRQNSSEPFFLSKQFMTVLKNGEKIIRETRGSFDYTIYALLKLWGFGPEANDAARIPDDVAISKALNHIGIEKLKIGEDNIVKNDPKLKLDLSAIAKGFAVDQAFEWLKRYGYNDIFIEIGGEIRSSGMNHNRTNWRVGIDLPSPHLNPGKTISSIIELNNSAIATSGDYRNFLEEGGVLRAHIIDPRDGYPADNNIISVSVLAPDCLTADAYATALSVLDLKEGRSLIDKQKSLEALWIISDDDENYQSFGSENFHFTKL